MSGRNDGDDGGGEVLQVFVRVRPPLSKELKLENAVTVTGGQSIGVRSEKYDVTCKYDRVFNDMTDQSSVFDSVRPLLSSVLNGYNACIFAYGQTSAGKSHTMLGPGGGTTAFQKTPKEDWGIIPRAVEFIFNEMYRAADDGYLSYKVKASFVQIYNENLYDLLKDTGPFSEDNKLGNTSSFGKAGDQGGLKIREIPRPGRRNGPTQYEVYISGLSEFRVQTEEDVMQLLEVGTRNRATRSTDFNDTSSRSHAILQLTFELEKQNDSGQVVLIRSKLSFADLAGSEKMGAIDVTNELKHIRELTAINQSLSSLGNVIHALSTNKNHIPYRDSKLTRILQDSLGGNTRTIVIVCVSPTALHAMETVSTLQFADRAKSVMLKVRANTVVDDKDLLAKANAEIARLKILLRQALKNNAERLMPRSHMDALSHGNSNSNVGISGGNSNGGSNNDSQSNLGNTSISNINTSSRTINNISSSGISSPRQQQNHNEITSQLFEENEKLKIENLKMRQALEWSIKLAKKKKQEDIEFHSASSEDIYKYKHVLNSIDLSPSALGRTMNSNNATKDYRSKDNREELPNIQENNPLNSTKGNSFNGLGASNRDLIVFKIPPSDQRGSAGSQGTPRVPTGLPTGKESGGKKKKKKDKSSLPNVHKTEKEMDYLEYVKNNKNNGNSANVPVDPQHQNRNKTPEMMMLSSYMVRTDYALRAYNKSMNNSNNGSNNGSNHSTGNYNNINSGNNNNNYGNSNNSSGNYNGNNSYNNGSNNNNNNGNTYNNSSSSHGQQTHGQRTDGQASPYGSRSLTVDTEIADKYAALDLKSQQQLHQRQIQQLQKQQSYHESNQFKQLEGEIYNTRKEVDRGRSVADEAHSREISLSKSPPRNNNGNNNGNNSGNSNSFSNGNSNESQGDRIIMVSESVQTPPSNTNPAHPAYPTHTQDGVGSIAMAVKESGLRMRPLQRHPESHVEAAAPSLPQMLAPDLSFSIADVGMVIQLFSFRYDCWGNMTLTDFDNIRGVHKCRLSDGTIQWLDLKKKPIRAVTDDNKNSR